MLLQLAVENYLSFRDRTVLSMLADPRVPHAPGQVADGPGGRKVLRAAAVYGANGSGKSNLVQALATIQSLVVMGTRGEAPLHLLPFKLEPTRPEAPCHLEVELYTGGKHYSYGFEATSKQVEAEWLYEIDASGAESVLFERETAAEAPGFTIGDALSTDPKRRQFLDFVAEGTRPNQLFLAEAGERNVQELSPLRRELQSWQVVLPESPYVPLLGQIQNDEAFRKSISDVLREAGTGIDGLEVRTSPLKLDELPEEVAGMVKLTTAPPGSFAAAAAVAGTARSLANSMGAELRTDDQGRPQMARLFSVHELASGDRIEFPLTWESDGTRRLLHLAPILHLAAQAGGGPFFGVDELERSLHPLLTRMLLQLFFARTAPGSGAQLIFTTHDTNLLDHRILSRDSVWLLEKDPRGGSVAYPLSDLDQAQIDEIESQGKGLERGYLQGRFGAIPFFGSLESLGLRKDMLK